MPALALLSKPTPNFELVIMQIVVFPFDLFGSAGTGAGAKLLGDAVREILDDLAEETRPCRADALRGKVKLKEVAFDAVADVVDWRKRGRQAARQALKSGEFVLWLGGNHLSVLPVLEELARRRSSSSSMRTWTCTPSTTPPRSYRTGTFSNTLRHRGRDW